LALSSRNAKLSSEQRRRAMALPRALSAGVAAHQNGGDASETASALLASDTQIETDYVEEMSAHGYRLLCAAIRLGDIRLIDNMILEEPA
ncbi:MAG: pantoate--beta-alanine ligase, partial [Gaiellaceae bacterium]